MEFSCVHSLLVGILRGTMVPPDEARATLLGRQRKRGRKAKAPGAWMYTAYDIKSTGRHPPPATRPSYFRRSGPCASDPCRQRYW